MDDGGVEIALTEAAREKLKQIVSKIERLEEEKKEVGGQVKDVYSEAKSGGFDPKIMRKVVSLRRLDKAERAEQEALLQVYLDAVGE